MQVLRSLTLLLSNPGNHLTRTCYGTLEYCLKPPQPPASVRRNGRQMRAVAIVFTGGILVTRRDPDHPVQLK